MLLIQRLTLFQIDYVTSCISCGEFPDIYKKSNICPGFNKSVLIGVQPVYAALALGVHSCTLL